MILRQSLARYAAGTSPARQASRLRIGSALLSGVVALLALLNLIAGAA